MGREDDERESSSKRPVVLLFPSPLQGHITPMLHLGCLLHSRGFSITVIETPFTTIPSSNFPLFSFHFIDDGLSSHQPPFDNTVELVSFLNSTCFQPFRDCLARILPRCGPTHDPVACLIADPLWSFAGAVAESFNLPRFSVRTGSLSAFLVYDSLPLLRAKGYFPRQEDKLDEPVSELPPLRSKDLPAEPHHGLLSVMVQETKNSRAIICNTFEELDSSALSKVQQSLPIPVFSIGPLHKFSPAAPSTSLLTPDQTSISWLNTQAPESVLYVSFGSAVRMSEAEFLEIAWGLADSNQPFLWVVRPGLVLGSETNDLGSIEGYLEKVSGRGHIVKWAPQQEVLEHPSVGGFWTHSGWNSTLESISAGVPMICLPFFADQAVNARNVSDSWGVGLRLERGVKRDQIETAIKKLMAEEEGKAMRTTITSLKEKAAMALKEGGSSHKSLEKLANFIRSL